ncbi:MAG: tRNA (adenine(22)-N(1))-methyltransferase [Syntrophomonadaceae bacterium]|jgi:tRNA (adenine22-N1)-methyltransferase
MKLDRRLQIIASMIIRDEPAADIGTDHALLPVYLVKNHLVPAMVVSDINPQPLGRAERIIRDYNLLKSIDIRLGDGLKVLDYGEVSTVVVAGLGGDTMAAILSQDWKKANSFKRFIFQPMSRAASLRNILSCQGWPIIDEEIVWENNRFFEVICCEPDNRPYQLTELEMDVGPVILSKRSPMIMAYLVYMLKKYQAMQESLLRAQNINEEKMREIRLKSFKLKEVLYAGTS